MLDHTCSSHILHQVFQQPWSVPQVRYSTHWSWSTYAFWIWLGQERCEIGTSLLASSEDLYRYVRDELVYSSIIHNEHNTLTQFMPNEVWTSILICFAVLDLFHKSSILDRHIYSQIFEQVKWRYCSGVIRKLFGPWLFEVQRGRELDFATIKHQSVSNCPLFNISKNRMFLQSLCNWWLSSNTTPYLRFWRDVVRDNHIFPVARPVEKVLSFMEKLKIGFQDL